MAENVIPAVVGEVVSTVASFIGNKFDKVRGVCDKIKWLEWKLQKIKSAIEESKKYDIDNEPLREMQQMLIDVAQKGGDVLRNFKSQFTTPDPQSSVQEVRPSNSTISLVWKMLTYGIVSIHDYLTHPGHLASELTTLHERIIGKRYLIVLDDIFQEVDTMSNDVGVFLEMVRQQKRKRQRRTRYRPYKYFFKLVYLEFAQNSLDYSQTRVSWMQLLLPRVATHDDSNRKFGMKVGAPSISTIPNMLLDVVACELLT